MLEKILNVIIFKMKDYKKIKEILEEGRKMSECFVVKTNISSLNKMLEKDGYFTQIGICPGNVDIKYEGEFKKEITPVGLLKQKEKIEIKMWIMSDFKKKPKDFDIKEWEKKVNNIFNKISVEKIK